MSTNDKTQSSSSDDFAELVRRVHGTYDMHVKVRPNASGGVDWIARLSGEDFLDGYWAAVRKGSAKNMRAAYKAATRPKKNDRFEWKFRDRNEWDTPELRGDF